MKRSLLCLLVVFVAIVSCEKDENADMGRKSRFIGYDILLSDDFKQGKTKSGETVGEDRTVAIGKFEGELGGESLYLHTIEQEWRPDAQATKGTIISSLTNKGMGISAWVYKDAYAAGQSYFSNDEHSIGSGAVTTDRYWPQKKDGWNMRFYAYAPLNAQIGEQAEEDGTFVKLPDASEWTGGVPSFSYTVPSDVTQQADLLVASSDVQNDSEAYGTAAVPMDFGHALTAVQFMVDGLSELNIKTIKISGVKNSGTYTYAYNVNGDGQSTTATHDAGVWSAQSGVGEYVLDFTSGALDTADGNQTPDGAFVCSGQEKCILNKDESDYVLFMMPQVLGESAIIEVEGESNGNKISLSASLQGKEWTKGQRVIYKISISEIDVHYVFEVEDVTTADDIKLIATGVTITNENVETKIVDEATVPYYGQLGRRYNVTSYKQITKLDETQRINLKWSIDRSNTSDWIDWIQECDFDESYNGVYEGKYNVVANVPNGISHDNLQRVQAKGTLENAYDLSQGGETANCYIVEAPGYYKLPLIYGNARGSNGLNYDSYISKNTENATVSATASDGVEVTVPVNTLDYFHNYLGAGISNAWIPSDLQYFSKSLGSADIIWQDEPCLVTEIGIKNDHLHFRVREDCICDGNAVIAIRDSEGKVVWSWHIWVTDNFMSLSRTIDVFNRRLITGSLDNPSNGEFANFVSEKFSMMPTYVGFCEGETKKYEPRSGKITFVQYDEGGEQHGEPLELPVVQEGNEVRTEDNTLYYQYGRKDPRPGAYAAVGDNNATVNKVYYLPNRRQYAHGYDGLGYVGFVVKDDILKTGQSTDIAYGIQNPGYQLPNWTNLYADDSGTKQEYENLGSPYDILIGHWSNNNSEGFYNLFNLWNTHSNVLPMFRYESRGKDVDYQYLVPNHSNLDDLIALGVTKTVYDPSPRGYEMPRVDAFMGFTYDGMNTDTGEKDGDFVNINTKMSFESIGGYYFYGTPMDAPGKEDDKAPWHIPIHALGYRNNTAGALSDYRTYGAALTSAPVCIEWGAWNEESGITTYKPNGYFSLQVAKLYFKYDSKSPLVYPMSSSDFSLAFPVIPVKTGANPVKDSAIYYDSDNIPETYNK